MIRVGDTLASMKPYIGEPVGMGSANEWGTITGAIEFYCYEGGGVFKVRTALVFVDGKLAAFADWTASNDAPAKVESPKSQTALPVLAHADDRNARVLISSAKWTKVSINGWSYQAAQNAAYAMCLTPSQGGSAMSVSGFENEESEGVEMNFEIQLMEPVDIAGNNEVLLISSRDAGAERSIRIECSSNSSTPVSKAFRIVSSTSSASSSTTKPEVSSAPGAASEPELSFTLAETAESKGGLSKLFGFLFGGAKQGKKISVRDGDTLSLPEGARLTALEDADIGVPVSLLAGARNIGAVISCDSGAKLWSIAGRGHPSLGVLVWVGVKTGSSLALAKSSLVVVGHPGRRSGKQMSFSLTDVVEEKRM